MFNQQQFDYDVFISYRSSDRPWVKNCLLKKLEALNAKVCIDYRDFRAGRPIITNIREAILKSRKILLILTPAYLDSEWTSFEHLLSQTLDPAGVQERMIPVLKDPCQLPLEINYLTYLNFATPEDEGLEWNKLFQSLGVKPVEPILLPFSPPKSPIQINIQQAKAIQKDLGWEFRDHLFAKKISHYLEARGEEEIDAEFWSQLAAESNTTEISVELSEFILAAAKKAAAKKVEEENQNSQSSADSNTGQ
ncbi:MAG TPA: hypothetical protein DCF68_00575 [Cyanothece sp. UBA12306]|nr:hypothetical protein [Cyanothece sp. UBA12306]